jgi:hypothetical protein
MAKSLEKIRYLNNGVYIIEKSSSLQNVSFHGNVVGFRFCGCRGKFIVMTTYGFWMIRVFNRRRIRTLVWLVTALRIYQIFGICGGRKMTSCRQFCGRSGLLTEIRLLNKNPVC